MTKKTGHSVNLFISLLSVAGKKSYCLFLEHLRNTGIALLAAIIVCMLSLTIFSSNASAAVAPSLYDCGGYDADAGDGATCADSYLPIEHGGQVQWSVIKSDEESDDSIIGEGCPGDTKPEMSLGYIIGIALAAGLAGILAMVVFTGVLLLITMSVLDGLRVACPPPHPDHPDLGAYWTHFGLKEDADGNKVPVSKMVFAYRPCIGLTIENETSGNMHKGVSSGRQCAGFRQGDDCDGFLGFCEDYSTIEEDEGKNEYQEWEGGHYEYLYGVFLGVKELEDKLCLYMEAGLSKVELVCQYKKEPAPPAVPQLACFMPRVCADANAVDQAKTKIPFSITATLVQCIEGTLDALFLTPSSHLTYYGEAESCNAISFMERFQLVMRRSVIGLLTLYIVFYGMKIAFGVQMPQRNDFFMKIITFSLVSYFALGTGWKDYYHVLVDITNTLASNIMDTTTSGGKYCDFPRESYEAGFEHNKLWDTLDCKIITYFFSNEDYPKLFAVGAYSFFGGGIVILLIGIVFALFLVLILIFAANVYIAALIGIAILAFLSPIFVPMALFGPTRKYFDGWLDEIIGFSLYPVILFGFVALMLVSFDTFMFNEKLSRTADGTVVFGNEKNEWLISGTEKATCNLRDRNPVILGEYTTTDEGSAIARCTAACWMYEAKLVNPASASGSSIPDCKTVQSYSPAPGGPQPVVSLCRTDGVCIEGDYKPKFRNKCVAVNRMFDTEDECRAFEVCTTSYDSDAGTNVEICNNPCNENDCVPQCDPDGFGCQLYKARFGGPGAIIGFAVDRFEMGTALLGLLKVLGIGVLFFHFLSVIGPMISEVIGNRHSSLASISVNPHAVMQKMISKVTAAATSGASKAASGAKNAVKRAGGGGGGDGGVGGGGSVKTS